MTGFVLIHGAGDVGWYWHLVEAQLRSRGHVTLAPDLPAGDDTLTLLDYRDSVLHAAATVQAPSSWVVVGQSFGAFTAPLVAEQLDADALVFVAGMIPARGEAPDDWWEDVGYAQAAARAVRDGTQPADDDPFATFYHDVPPALAAEAMSRERAHPSAAAGSTPWPLATWPRASVTSVVCAQDRFLPPDLQRRLARERLGVDPVEIDGGHCVALSRPRELADLLEGAAPPSSVYAIPPLGVRSRNGSHVPVRPATPGVRDKA
jgi:hypothetical protein